MVSWILSVALAGHIGITVGLRSRDLLDGLVGFVIVTCLGSLTCAILLGMARRRCSRDCCGLTRAVLYLGSAGSFHSFEIRSKLYASEFVRSNHRKLVNATPQVVSLLRGMDFGEYQVARRMIRRHR